MSNDVIIIIRDLTSVKFPGKSKYYIDVYLHNIITKKIFLPLLKSSDLTLT